MGPESMTDIRPLQTNSSMARLLTPRSLISTSSLSGCLANVIAPIIEVTALISASVRPCPNDVVMTVEYKKYKLSSPSVSSFNWRTENCTLGFNQRKSATVVAQINIPAARGAK